MKSSFYMKLGILWVVVGLFLSAPFWVRFARPASVVNAAPDTSVAINTDTPYIGGTPVRIAFPALGIDERIIPGVYDERSKTWTLSDTDAQYATITPEPNNKTGNTFIYGHNNLQVFGKLLDAKVGLEARVTTGNGVTLRYTLRKIADVQPDDMSFLAPHNAPILTVQTCSGFWSETRRMFVFDYVEVL